MAAVLPPGAGTGEAPSHWAVQMISPGHGSTNALRSGTQWRGLSFGPSFTMTFHAGPLRVASASAQKSLVVSIQPPFRSPSFGRTISSAGSAVTVAGRRAHPGGTAAVLSDHLAPSGPDVGRPRRHHGEPRLHLGYVEVGEDLGHQVPARGVDLFRRGLGLDPVLGVNGPGKAPV